MASLVEVLEQPHEAKRKKIQKGKYISLACAFCKRRHFKCDGNPSGCNNCIARSQECHYVQPAEKRGPKPKRQRSETNDSHDIPPIPQRTSVPFETQIAVDIWAQQQAATYAEVTGELTITPWAQNDRRKNWLAFHELANASAMFTPSSSVNITPLDSSNDAIIHESARATTSTHDIRQQKASSTSSLDFSTDQSSPQSSGVESSFTPSNSSSFDTIEPPVEVRGVQFSLPQNLVMNDQMSSSTQKVGAYLYIYVKTMESFYPLLDIPPVWRSRMERIIDDEYSTEDDIACQALLQSSFQKSLTKDLPELLLEIKLHMFLAFGSRFANKKAESTEHFSIAKELLRYVYDKPFLEVGFVHLLVALYNFGEGDMKSALYCNNLALTCVSCCNRFKDPEERARLEVSALINGFMLGRDYEERFALYNKLRAMNPDPIYFSYINFFFIAKQLLDENSSRQVNTNVDLSTFVAEMQSHNSHFIYSGGPNNERSYRLLIVEVIFHSINSMVLLRSGNNTEALSSAKKAVALLKHLHFCCLGVPLGLCFAVAVFAQLDEKGPEYYDLLKSVVRFMAIYPGIDAVAISLQLPSDDIQNIRKSLQIPNSNRPKPPRTIEEVTTPASKVASMINELSSTPNFWEQMASIFVDE